MTDRTIPFTYRGGVFLPEMGLWLDPKGSSPFAFVSHAHADHARRHKRVIATPETAALMRTRGLHQSGAIEFPYGEERDFDGGRVELFPAGHVLGSAQIRLTTDSGSLVYTGDFKFRAGLSCEPPEVRPADVLIMETTYGLPRYRLPPPEEVAAEMVTFCRDSLEADAVPVLLGYSLGKAQEILAALDGQGFEILVHKTVARMTQVYRDFGRRFPHYESFDGQNPDGKVLILPPSVDRSKLLSEAESTRTAAVTGWGLDSSARYRFGCDAVFPLSDHAGYDDLFRYVEMVNPRVVYTLHGYAEEFARDLRARGVEAWSLISNNQLEFPLGI